MHQITSILLRTAARPITAIDIWNFFFHPFDTFLFVDRAQAEFIFCFTYNICKLGILISNWALNALSIYLINFSSSGDICMFCPVCGAGIFCQVRILSQSISSHDTSILMLQQPIQFVQKYISYLSLHQKFSFHHKKSSCQELCDTGSPLPALSPPIRGPDPGHDSPAGQGGDTDGPQQRDTRPHSAAMSQINKTKNIRLRMWSMRWVYFLVTWHKYALKVSIKHWTSAQSIRHRMPLLELLPELKGWNDFKCSRHLHISYVGALDVMNCSVYLFCVVGM